MKRMLIKETALYNDFSLLNSPVREIRGGEIVELGNVVEESGNEWIEVLLNNTVTDILKAILPL